MEVLYLNLERRKERDEQFRRLNAAIADFRRWNAVDGGRLRTEDLLRERVIAEPLRAYTPGALGCAMSHRSVWEHSVATTAVQTVAEDDAVFNRHFAAKAANVLAALPPDWDVVLWGWNFDAVLHAQVLEGMKQSVMRFDRRRLGSRLSEFQERQYDVLPLRLIAAFGTVCYSVSPKGAQRLIERCFPLKNEKIAVPGMRWSLPNAGIDVVMNKHYGTLKSYVSFPPLVWTENDKASSDIHPKEWSLARVLSWLWG